jgi:hypothetical protein
LFCRFSCRCCEQSSFHLKRRLASCSCLRVWLITYSKYFTHDSMRESLTHPETPCVFRDLVQCLLTWTRNTCLSKGDDRLVNSDAVEHSWFKCYPLGALTNVTCARIRLESPHSSRLSDPYMVNMLRGWPLILVVVLCTLQSSMTVRYREGAVPTSGFLGPVQDLGGSSVAVTIPSWDSRWEWVLGLIPWQE